MANNVSFTAHNGNRTRVDGLAVKLDAILFLTEFPALQRARELLQIRQGLSGSFSVDVLYSHCSG